MTGRQDDRQDDRQRILDEYMIDMCDVHSLKRVVLVTVDTINLRVKRRTFAMGLNSEPRKSENRRFPWP